MNKKIIFLLIAGFTIRLFFSCCRTVYEHKIPFDLNLLTVYKLDNSSPTGYIRALESDTMLSKAIAFQVTLTDSAYVDDHWLYTSNIGFVSTHALSCPEFYNFIISSTVKSIHIYSLYDLTETIMENDDATELFLALPSDNSLYKTIEDLYPLINSKSLHQPGLTLSFYCKEDIQRDSVNFEIKIQLSDDKVLTGSTGRIYLKPSNNP